MDLRRNTAQLWVCCIAFAWGLSACNIKMDAPDQTDGTQRPEAAYCGAAQATAYSGSTTVVSGNAKFNYRNLDWVGPTCTGLCGNPTATSLNIPFAEVHVVDANSGTIQCGETDEAGNYALTIPRAAGTYTVQVYSRAMNSNFKASVLEDIYSAAPYYIEKSFSNSGAQATITAINLIASAQASVAAKIPGA
ncbi:MAG: carboxypeptidase regulatory-like domain-containing protein, partial [Bdellovibrionaceae bacterium]|nr:carboxypeptidase regulatory-like domain-containing protein [Pseudobdellovibrionaceae bacterium]